MGLPARAIPAAIALTLAVLTLAACSGPSRTAPPVPGPMLRLVAYNGCQDLLDGLRAATEKQVGLYGLPGDINPLVRGAGPRVMAPLDGVAAAGATGADGMKALPGHSGTNNQEPGVDEPDLVKTDGTRIVTLAGGTLKVIDVASRQVTGTLTLPGRAFASQLLLQGDRALVIEPQPYFPRNWSGKIPGGRPGPAFGGGTRLVEVNLSPHPAVVATLTFEGTYLAARQVGPVARVVVRSAPQIDLPQPAEPPTGPPPTPDPRIEANRQAVRQAPLSAWLPKYTVESGGTSQAYQVPCEQVSHPRTYSGTAMLTVFTLDLGRGIGDARPVSVVADGQTVYASATGLYVTHQQVTRVPMPEPVPAPRTLTPLPAPPNRATPPPAVPGRTPGRPHAMTVPHAADQPATGAAPPAPASPPPAGSGVAPAASASAGGGAIAPDGGPVNPATPVTAQPATEIHKFDISGTGRPRYVASGSVPGSLLGPYSMSEYGGNLRVAATLATGADGTTVQVLLQHGPRLDVAGSVGGLGKGQRVYAVRFLGPRGYVVTFRQIDPLYTLELSDPAHPAVTGTLELDGYSAYLHPVSDGRLLGVGQDATAAGRPLGTQVSLFDVTAAPKRLSSYRLPDSRTEAEYDPHAFLYWPQSGLTVLPVTTGGLWAAKVLVLTVTPDGVRERGTIQHPGTRTATIQRSVLIGSTLWTFSGQGAQANDARTLARQAWLPY